jgi:uncharacterized protein (DUF305 family)
MSKLKITAACVVCLLIAGAAAAAAKNNPAVAGYMAAMTKMHDSMMIDYTGDADVDFVRGMIPHHQGAIDMAKVELAYGKDPELRRMAEGIINAQETEIATMKTWLKAHGK